MISAPFTGADAAAALAPLAAIFIAFGGIGMMLRARRFASRALGLGAVIAFLAAVAPQAFR